MDKNEIVQILINNRNWLSERVFRKKFPEIYKDFLNYRYDESFPFKQKLYHYLHDDFDLKLGVCPECGNRCFFKNFYDGYCGYCSPKCAGNSKEVREKIKRANREKFGCDYPMQSGKVREKSRETCLEKYGVHHTGAARECIAKRHKTCEEKYGSASPFSDKNVQEKIKETNLEKYGVENVFQNKEIQEKIKNTMLDKYGTEKYGKTESGRKDITEKVTKTKRQKSLDKDKNILKISDTEFTVKCDIPGCKCGGQYTISKYLYHMRKRNNQECCIFTNPISKHYSYEEKELLTYISRIYNGIILENNKKALDGQEIDIFLPDLNIGFEFNGDYWHMNPVFHKENEILAQSGLTAKEIWANDKYKTELAESKNIKLYTVWENDWLNDNENTKRKIKELIYAETS